MIVETLESIIYCVHICFQGLGTQTHSQEQKEVIHRALIRVCTLCKCIPIVG